MQNKKRITKIPPTVRACKTSGRVKSDPPDRRQLREAISTLKNDKAPRVDNITAEVLKADTETSSRNLIPLFKLMWDTNSLPEE
jgi:hypothetical protein